MQQFISGQLPIEAQIHKRKLTFFNNVCHQSDNSIEKQLAVRQSTVKNMKSNSWFIEVKKILWKYDLGNIDELIINPIPKSQWNNVVNKFWKERIIAQAELYKTLKYINPKGYQPGEVNKLLAIEPRSTRDVNRISTKLRFLCTHYSRTEMYITKQWLIQPASCVRGCDEENLEHFILNCSYLEYIRNPIISTTEQEVDSLLGKSCFQEITDHEKLCIILDCTILSDQPSSRLRIDQLSSLEFHTRRLIHNLSGVRYRTLKETPKNSTRAKVK